MLVVAGALSVAATCVVPVAASAQGVQPVVLGAADYAPYGGGWGTAEPSELSNGGVPSGVLTHIRWRDWGKPVARGVARASIYKPAGGYYPHGARALLRVSRIGQCPGTAAPAYTVLEVRLPTWPGGPPGGWFKWSGNATVCDNESDLPNYNPGYCGYTGSEYGLTGQARDINAYRVRCARARRIALRSRGMVSPMSSHGRRRACGRTGCRVRIGRFRCRFQPVRQVDNDPLPSSGPVQRVACRKGTATITWLYSRYPY